MGKKLNWRARAVFTPGFDSEEDRDYVAEKHLDQLPCCCVGKLNSECIEITTEDSELDADIMEIEEITRYLDDFTYEK